ncbi:insulinase family protein [Paracoccaceae bacterium]|nr:insulinase family protein [Paracoccaceae bacterium]
MELGSNANWGDSPLYHFLTLPDLAVIDDVSVDMLRQWHDQTFTQSDLTIVVTGTISWQAAGSSVDTLLFDQPKGRVSPPHDVNVMIKPQNVFLHVSEAEKTTIGILGRLPPTFQVNDLTDLLALSHFSQNGSGPLFSALRTEQRLSYGFQAGFFYYNRKNRLLIITGAVAADQAADVAADIAEIYEDYRLNPNFETLPDLQNGMVNQTQKNFGYVNIAARTLVQLALDKRDPKIAPKLHNELKKLHTQDLKSRMKTIFPPKSELAIFAAGPSKMGWSDACVISKIEALDEC